MYKLLPIITVIIALGFSATVMLLAQEGEPPEPPPSEQPDETETEEKAAPAAIIDNWQGEVLLKKTEMEDFEILAPVGEEKASLFSGDTVKTTEGATLTLTFTDGTIIELGPNSELVIEKNIEGSIVVRLIFGEADITFGSDGFEFICARHTIKGKDSRVQVKSPDRNTISIFGIEEGSTIENEYGHIFYLGQGQKMEVNFIEDEEVFQVTVHEFNEVGLKIEVDGKGKIIDPGISFTIDADGVIVVGEAAPPPVEKPVVPPTLPLELEEPEDEPFENAGDLKEIWIVSPKKP
jgi:hypothetical protein